MEAYREAQPGPERLADLGVADWSPWSRDEDTFEWSYSDTETGYIREGAVRVHLPGDQVMEAESGDLVQFPAGLECTWEITEDLSKVYTFDSVQLKPDETYEILDD